MESTDRLGVGRRHPVELEEKAVRRGWQVDADSTRFQGDDDEPLLRIDLETLDEFVPFFE